MKNQLSLTSEQYAKVLDVLSEHSALLEQQLKMKAAWESTQPYKDSLNSVKTEKIQRILSEEQFALWTRQQDQLLSEDRQQAKEEVDAMKEPLSLDEAQANALEDLTFKHLQYMQKQKAIQQGSGQLQPRFFLRAESEYRDGVAEILSEEQFEKWKQLDQSK